MKRTDNVQSPFFYYKNERLYCEQVQVKSIIETYGTPIFIMSQGEIEARYTRFVNAFSKLKKTKIYYAVKANYNLSVIRTLYKLGAGMDVNSEGELYRATKAGVKPEHIIMSGVGKSMGDLTAAIKKGIKMIKAESVSELHRIEAVASSLKKKASVGVRINPDVEASTHPYISTGKKDIKFGIEVDIVKKQVIPFFKKATYSEFSGLEMHIGSQIFEPKAYAAATERIVSLAKTFRNKAHIDVKTIDLGGGFGITYDKKEPETPIEHFANAVIPIVQNETAEILFEPGRFLVGNAGILATQALYLKKSLNRKRFIVVDAAMTELIRPSLYSAYHDIIPEKKTKAYHAAVDVVGPVCETGDFLAKGRKMPAVKEGEWLAVMSCGAYASVMSSHYNARRKPAQVMVSKRRVSLISKRETLKQLIQNEV